LGKCTKSCNLVIMPNVDAIEVYSLNEAEEKQLILREYRKLLNLLKARLKDGDKKLIRQAFEVAAESHKNTRRKSGEPYILHPIAVAQIVVEEIGLGVRSALAALLHDTVEDTEITLEDIERDFGKEIMRIIDGLTKISYVEEKQNATQQSENFRKVLLTLIDDPRVVLIKIADRLHNMRTMNSMKRDKQLKISGETSFIYAPLAHRLGLYEVQSELQDLSLKYTEPEVYSEIANRLKETKKDRDKFIKEFITPIKKEIDTAGFKCEITGRSKSINSILNKIRTKHVTFEEVYDLFAIRIIVEPQTVNEHDECWRIYGILSSLYQASQNRLRDWLSVPKGNGYEALHNTFMSGSGKWVEVQIRTKRMNEIAEKGIAAHWKYKEGSNEKPSNKADNKRDAENKIDKFLEHIREMMKNIDTNSIEFVADIKRDLFKEEMYVYTPKGEMRVLTVDATALDFAFDIHSALGAKCIGAKVNYKLVPLSHVLKNGDQVEIITSNKQKPNDDWLKFVVTGKAKSRIRYYLKEEKRNIAEEGKYTAERKLKSLGIPFTTANIQEVVTHLKISSPLDLFYNIATGITDLSTLKNFKVHGDKLEFIVEKKLTTKEVVNDFEPEKELNAKGAELVLFGESSNHIKYKLANCCNPIQGDDVFGFISSSDGLKIHRLSCPNAPGLMANYAHRIIKAKWAGNKSISFLTAIRITGLDDVGMISKITTVISGNLKINMRSMKIESQDGIFEGTITVFVGNKIELDKLCRSLEELEGVQQVLRLESDEN
jgi:GTP diphosphokinase / guanosine-3',5'-bis(diphosphate) 3'-diphosphatase